MSTRASAAGPGLFACGLLLLAAPVAEGGDRAFDVRAGTNSDGSMYFEPSDLVVRKGDLVTIRVTNVDPAGTEYFHDLAILDWGGPRRHLEWEVEAQSTVSRTFEASNVGKFRMICEVPGHEEAGMKGTFTVKEGGGLPGLGLGFVLAGLTLGLVGYALRRPR